MSEPGREAWTFGVEPLPQTIELAASMRRVISLALALETPNEVIDRLNADLDEVERELAHATPPSPTPRVGTAVDSDGRAYIDHSRKIGLFNPCFPEYEITVDGERAWGTVSFPVAYEGPPGIVHGGFVGLFFDAAVQHHNCDVGVAGKTTSMSVRYRRPTPLLTELRFEMTRTVSGDRISSVAQLLRDDDLLCEAHIEAVAGDRAALPPVSPRARE